MALSKEILRNLLLYEFELGRDATTAAGNINRAKGRRVVPERTARWWFAKFRDGDTNVNDQPRSGRPREIDREAVIEAIDLDPTLTTEDLADEFECTQMAIWKILKAAGKKWIFFQSQRRRNQCLSPGQQGTPTPRPNQHAPKAMLIVFWNRNGPLHWDLLPAGETINAERYCEHLDRCNQALPRRHRRNVILLHDNARPHIARLTQAKLTELHWERLDHPPYSPDLSPSDYHLFRSLEHFLSEQRFRNIEHLRRELTTWFASKGREFYARGIDLLPERWQNTVNFNGEYFD
jgi:histone-lysine N-methyltransferase SETMAR